MSRAKAGRRCGEGRVAFLAVAEEVRKAIRAGWPRTAVYGMHREKLAGIGQRQFDRYVLRYVNGREEGARARQRTDSERVAPEAVIGSPAKGRLPTFQFDPDAKDLNKLI